MRVVGRDVEYLAASRQQKSIPYPLRSIDAVCRNTANKPSATAQHRSHLANLDEAFS